jgi:hypothetical protein
MIMFVMTNYVTKKSYGAMVKDLNLQSEGEGFESSQLQPKILEVICLWGYVIYSLSFLLA